MAEGKVSLDVSRQYQIYQERQYCTTGAQSLPSTELKPAWIYLLKRHNRYKFVHLFWWEVEYIQIQWEEESDFSSPTWGCSCSCKETLENKKWWEHHYKHFCPHFATFSQKCVKTTSWIGSFNRNRGRNAWACVPGEPIHGLEAWVLGEVCP